MNLKNEQEISLEKVKKFFEWLQGTPYENMSLNYQPNLSPEEAFTIIYVLQEELKAIPDNIEMCRECKTLFSTNQEERCIDEDSLTPNDEPYSESDYGNYCDNCAPMY